MISLWKRKKNKKKVGEYDFPHLVGEGPPGPEIRVKMEEEHFLSMVKGEVVEIKTKYPPATVKIIMSDIGYDRIIEKLLKIMTGVK